MGGEGRKIWKNAGRRGKGKEEEEEEEEVNDEKNAYVEE